jgi:hypothetical protein
LKDAACRWCASTAIVPGRYQAEWPVYVAYDDPSSLTFTVLVDTQVSFSLAADHVAEDSREETRRYITAAVQSVFINGRSASA